MGVPKHHVFLTKSYMLNCHIGTPETWTVYVYILSLMSATCAPSETSLCCTVRQAGSVCVSCMVAAHCVFLPMQHSRTLLRDLAVMLSTQHLQQNPPAPLAVFHRYIRILACMTGVSLVRVCRLIQIPCDLESSIPSLILFLIEYPSEMMEMESLWIFWVASYLRRVSSPLLLWEGDVGLGCFCWRGMWKQSKNWAQSKCFLHKVGKSEFGALTDKINGMCIMCKPSWMGMFWDSSHLIIFILLTHANCMQCLHASDFIHSLSKGVCVWLPARHHWVLPCLEMGVNTAPCTEKLTVWEGWWM